MTADLLRRAAKEMRERAEAATPSYWFADAGNVFANSGDPTDGAWVAWDIRQGNATHIASWDPAVALGIASLFENIADEWERVQPCEKDCANCSGMTWSWPTAELVAKDYLGEPS